MINVSTPLQQTDILKLKCGDQILLNGTIFTARDKAHQRLITMLESNNNLPFDIKDQVLFYAGPTPAHHHLPLGVVGPTTSSRMDRFTIPLLENGLKGMIGKGPRDEIVRNAIKKHGAVYFAAVGGVAALLTQSIISASIIAFEDLGTEAIFRVDVKEFPCIVAIDSRGNDIYEQAAQAR